MVRPTRSFNTSTQSPPARTAQQGDAPHARVVTGAHFDHAGTTQSDRLPSPRAAAIRRRLAIAYAAPRDEFTWADLLARCADAREPSTLMTLVRSAPAGINDRDSDGKTLVEVVLKNGGAAMASVVTELRAQGADLVAADEEGNTLLHRMVMAQNVPAIDLLLQNGVDVNAFNRYTQATIARYAKNPRAIHDSMSKPNWYWGEDDTATPAHLAAAFGNAAVLRTLIRHGANITLSNKDRLTPLHWGVIFSDNPHVPSTLFAAGASVNIGVEVRCAPLHLVATSGCNEDMIHFLIDHGAQLEAKDEEGCTALHRAAANPDNPNILAALIARGAQVHATDNHGSTPAEIAVYCLRPQSASLLAHLKEAGADLELPDMNGNTLLHRAVIFGNEVAVRALLKAGVNVNAFNHRTDASIARYAKNRAAATEALTNPSLPWEDVDNATALHLTAAISADPSIARALVEHGADIHLRNAADCAAINWAAMRSSHPPMIDALIALGAEPNPERTRHLQPLHAAATYSRTVGIATALIRAGAIIDAVIVDGATPLMYAALPSGHPDMVRTLLQHGANPNWRGINNLTALHAAAISPHCEKVRALIESGADINAEDRGGRTPLHYAQIDNPEQPDIANLLIAHGARCRPALGSQSASVGPQLPPPREQRPIDLERDFQFAQALAQQEEQQLQQLEAHLLGLVMEESASLHSILVAPDRANTATVIDQATQHQLTELPRLLTEPLVQHIERWFSNTDRAEQAARASAWHAIKDEVHAGEFQDFLSHLHETADYRHPLQRTDYIQRVAHLLNAIQHSAELRQQCFLLVEEATSTCGDRVGLTLNHLDMARIEHEAAQGLHSTQDLINIRTSQFRIQILGELAQQKIVALRPVLGDRLDELEVMHGAITLLADELNLIGVSRTMLYRSYAHFSDEDKRAALALISRRESRGEYIKFIAEWQPWQTQLRRLRPADFNDLDQRVASERDSLAEQPDYTSDNDYVELCRRMEDMQRSRLAFSLENWTREWLVQNRQRAR